MRKTSIIVVDDHQLVREMSEMMFASSDHYEVIASSGLLEEALGLISRHRPDVVLLDINLAQGSGFDALPAIRQAAPGTRVIAVTMYTQPSYAKKMIRLGAHGYVTKSSSRKEMFAALEKVMGGGQYICDEIKEILAEQMLMPKEAASALEELTPREAAVLSQVRQGKTSKDIAAELNLSVKTVAVHRYHIMKKLGYKIQLHSSTRSTATRITGSIF